MPSRVELSGGQQQRIAIVRSLCMNPEVMLFDEVTAALDPRWSRRVLQVIQGLARDGMTLLIVTHEMAFARAVADRIVFMEADGILEQNTPSNFFATADRTRAAVPGEILFCRKPAQDIAQGTVMKTAPLAKLLAPLLGLALLAGCNKAEEPAKTSAASPASSYLDTIKARDKLSRRIHRQAAVWFRRQKWPLRGF